MPKCGNCNTTQSRLNKGGLCKGCFHKKINPTIINSDDNKQSKETNDRASTKDSLMEVMKENMITEKKLNENMQKILMDQVEFLKNEIVVKNTLIERLLSELYNNHPASNYSDIDKRVLNKSLSSTEESSYHHTNESSSLNIRERNDTENDHHSCNNNIVHPNRNQVLINDDESTFENEVIAAKINGTHKPPPQKKDDTNKKSETNAINKFPENDCT